MIVNFGRFGMKAVLVWMECLAVVVGLSLFVAGVFAWRLSAGPVDVSFARETIEQALNDPVSGYSVTLQNIILEWPDLKGPVQMQFDQVGLVKNEKEILTVGSVALGLSTAHLLTGSIEPVSISLARVALHLIRTEDNRVILGIEDSDTALTEEAIESENPLMRIVNTLTLPEGTLDKRSPLDRLRRVEINDAAMVMEDHVLGISWYLQDLNLAFVRDERGLVVDAGIKLPGGSKGQESIDASVIYDRERKDFQITARVRDFDPRIVSRKVEKLSFLDNQDLYLNGDASFTLNHALEIQAASGQFYTENGALVLDGVYDAPLEFQRLALDVSYDPAQNRIDLQEALIQAHDVEIQIGGAVALQADKISAPLTFKIAHLPQEKIAPVWPDVMRGTSIEGWLLHRLSSGSVDNIVTDLTLAAEKKDGAWITDVSAIESSFDIADMTVDYSAPLAPAKNTFGQGRFADDVLSIKIDSATVDDMTISGGSVTIDHVVSDAVGQAKINVDLKGRLPSILKYIESEPIGMKGENLGVDPKRVKGDARLDISVAFPTLRDLPKEEVDVTASGTLENVLLPDVVKTLDLSGGPLSLSVDNEKVVLTGNGKLDGRNIVLEWEQFLESKGKPYSSKIKASIDADKGLRESLGLNLDDWLEGTVPAKVTYTEYANGRSEVIVDGDLQRAIVKVLPFNYAKPASVPGRVTCTAILQNGYVQEIRKLNVKTPELDVQNGIMRFDTVKGESILRGGEMSRVKLNETDALLEFQIGAGGALKVGLRGTFLDARPFLKKKQKQGPYEGPPILASVDVAKMRTGDRHIVDRAKIYLDMNKDGLVNQVELDAVAGKGAVYLRLKPDSEKGVTVFRFEADDAGATLQAFDVYKNVRGGKIILTGQSLPGKSRYAIYGKAQLSDFNVVNAPALARLVGAISPTGLPMLLSNDGLYFSRLEAGFEWHLRPAGDIYVIKDGRSSGSSLGLTFEGKIDKGKNYTDIDGHVVPMSEINSLVSSIPLLGQLLTGGSEGGIFAATYTMRGPTDKPEVSVNPLSFLAPGIIRRILFED